MLVGLVGSLVALVGFASTANASATVDLIWSGSGTATTSSVSSSSTITLNLILTAGAGGISAAAVSVDYSDALAKGFTVVGLTNAPNGYGNFNVPLGTAMDTGSTVTGQAVGSFFTPGLGAGLSFNLVAIQFHKGNNTPGAFEIGLYFAPGNDVSSVAPLAVIPQSQVTLNSAYVVNPVVPEPGTVSLLALGLGGLALAGRRKN
jgi:hypothetical protein